MMLLIVLRIEILLIFGFFIFQNYIIIIVFYRNNMKHIWRQILKISRKKLEIINLNHFQSFYKN